MPPAVEKPPSESWAAGRCIGIAESRGDLDHWEKLGELHPAQTCHQRRLCAPGAFVRDGQLPLFYQTYGNGAKDAICHAWSEDGVTFPRDPSNPIVAANGRTHLFYQGNRDKGRPWCLSRVELDWRDDRPFVKH